MFQRAVKMIQTLLERSKGAANRYPSTKDFPLLTARQAARAERTFAQLARRAVPAYAAPLCVEDDETVHPQSADAVARRVMTLWGVNLRAEGFPQEKALGVIEGLGLWDCLTAGEETFLMAIEVDPNEARARVWRLEAIWVLLWALGHVERLDWPRGMCDVERLVRIVIPSEGETTFITEAKLRPVAELLDMQQLTLCLHWAIRDAYLNHGGMLPEKLDWTKPKRVPISIHTPAMVVDQRHHALNWLLNSYDPKDWDDVDTPT